MAKNSGFRDFITFSNLKKCPEKKPGVVLYREMSLLTLMISCLVRVLFQLVRSLESLSLLMSFSASQSMMAVIR